MARPLFLLCLLCLVSCISQKVAEPERQETSALVASFTGIESTTNLTDSTVTLTWTVDSNAVGYRIYTTTTSTFVLHSTIYNTNTATLTGLTEGTAYYMKVNSFDFDGNEYETDPVIVTTKSAPDKPTQITLVAPTIYPYYNPLPTVKVWGVKEGDHVFLHDDSSCSGVELVEEQATGDSIELTPDNPLSSGATLFYARVQNPTSGTFSSCSSATLYYYLNDCPSGYAYVYPNATLGTSGFCVMRYEARAWIDSDGDMVVDSSETVDSDGCNESSCTTKDWGLTTYKPGATIRNRPWRNMSFRAARNACLSLGEKFDLISNDEWMAMAYEIEQNALNWSGGIVGDGCIKSGNTGEDSECSYSEGAVTSGSTNILLRAQALTSNVFVYDVAGNLAEWVGWHLSTGLESKIITCSQTAVEAATLACADMGYNEYYPFDPSYDSEQYFGKITAISSGYGIRGGHLADSRFAGIYSLNFISSDSYVPNHVGFRCVYRP